MKAKVIGISLLVIIIAGGIFFQMSRKKVKVTNVTGDIGGEKKDFLDSEKVKKILKDNYGYSISYTKKGSIEMVRDFTSSGQDFLWPSSEVALELFKQEYSSSIVDTDIIFNSPIVIFSWDIVCDALVAEKIVSYVNGTYYIDDFKRLLTYMVEGKKWSSLGIKELNGKIMIVTTDPSRSNSGNMFAGLLANVLIGDVATNQTIGDVLPDIQAMYSKLGYLQDSSSKLFQNYLTQGVGAYPMIAGYESQVIEFSHKYPDIWPRAKEKIRILYPRPTVWSSHPIIVLNNKSRGLIKALQDDQVKKLAWEKHGFRSGPNNDPEIFDIKGIPESITNVSFMPRPEVMEMIIKTVE